ncbi:MAG: RecQ family ATP-dependent DNA helicase [Balneolaceae bacterium]|nr:RecQ family ATP-dependent DNA helicase [Balneolaceae bacterium]
MKKPTLHQAEMALKKYWGYDSFRQGQQEAIEAVLDGRDTLVLFPTGGGKSLCYQVPGVLFDGLTVVVSPLIALMQDQVDQLNKLGIRSTFINSTIPHFEVEQRLVNARNGMYKLIYIAPERLKTDLWKAEQPRLNINLIAVDEAHCISEWGHDFRPAYRRIREEFDDINTDVRWIALTATATPEVKKDLLNVLGFSEPLIVTSGFKRENLHWWVTHTERKQHMLNKAVKWASAMGSGIIYSPTRKDCEQLARRYSDSGILAKPYHAGMSNEERKKVQNGWLDGSFPLVASTNAFGMGIDKPDCRFVIHHTMPFSLEAYYQEAGRAGRDGKVSYPLLLVKPGDADYLKKRILQSYPDYAILRKVYDALCDELELAVGSTHEKPEAVAIDNIARRIKMRSTNVATAMNLLQRLEIIHQSDLREPRVGIHFIVSNDYLIDFIDRTEPEKGEFLDLLYRQFGPQSIRDFYYLDESNLLEKLKVTSNQLRKALKLFSTQDQLLNFEWEADAKLVHVTEARSKKLHIDHHQAYHYKEILLKKLDYMHQYANTKSCRELFLRRYFGEDTRELCGNCDNCKKRERNVIVIEKDADTIRALLKNESRTMKNLAQQTGWSKKKLKKVMNILIREGVVVSDDTEQHSYRLRIR